MPYKDPQKRKEASRKSRLKKPEHYRNYSTSQSRTRAQRGYFIQWRYGITLEEYEKILVGQDGACAICFKVPNRTKSNRSGLHVDHNHITKKVRGLLCARCNSLVGFWEKENGPETIERARKYLENYS